MFDVIIIPQSGSLTFESSSINNKKLSRIRLNNNGLLEFLDDVIFRNAISLENLDLGRSTDNLLVIGSSDNKVKYIARNRFSAAYASFALSSSYAISSSFAETSSYSIFALNARTSSYAFNANNSRFATTASYTISSSYALSSSFSLTASFTNYANYAGNAYNAYYANSAFMATSASWAISASWASRSLYSHNANNAYASTFATTASYTFFAQNSATASYTLTSSYAFYALSSLTSSHAINARTASYALNASNSQFSQTASFALNYPSTLRFTNNIISRLEILDLINTNVNNSEQLISFKFATDNLTYITASISSLKVGTNNTQLLFYNNTTTGYRISSLINENSDFITSGSLISRRGNLILFSSSNFSMSLQPSNLNANRTILFPNKNGTVILDTDLQSLDLGGSSINLKEVGGYYSNGTTGSGVYLYMTHSNALNIFHDDFTIEMVFSTFYINNDGTKTNRVLFSKGSNYRNLNSPGITIYIDNQDKLALSFRRVNMIETINITSSLIIQTGSLYHFVLTRTQNNINFYINNVLDTTYNIINSNFNNTQSINLFALVSASSVVDHNAGRLVLFRMFNYALSSSEINILYKNYNSNIFTLNNYFPYANPNTFIYSNSNFAASNNFGNFTTNSNGNFSFFDNAGYSPTTLRAVLTRYITGEFFIHINSYTNMPYKIHQKYKINITYANEAYNAYKISLFTKGILNYKSNIFSMPQYSGQAITSIFTQSFDIPNQRLGINILNNAGQYIYYNDLYVGFYLISLYVYEIGCILDFNPINAGANGWVNAASNNVNLHLQTSGSVFLHTSLKDVKTYISNSQVTLFNTWQENHILKNIMVINQSNAPNFYYIGINSHGDLYNNVQILPNSTQLLNVNLFSSVSRSLLVQSDSPFISVILFYEKVN